jgi:tRNA(Ile)-lysidine synthase
VSGLPELVDQSVRARGLFRAGQRILVAVSGGVDSMALLHLLHQLSKKDKWRLTVAHFNHQLRGRSSAADERLVARAAKALRLPIVIERTDVKNRAKMTRLSIEMAAREARHEFLARTAARLRIPSIALAHHADDQLELFFVRLLRGSGSEGLGGMKWRNLSPFRPAGTKIELVRPLLDQSKESLRRYSRHKNIKSREDASNESLDILRNRIRHELLPLLRRKYQAALDKIILRLMDLTSVEAEVTEQIAQTWLASKVFILPKEFSELPLAIQRRVVQLELRGHKIPADFALVERLRAHPGVPLTISPETAVTCDANGKLHLRKPVSFTPDLNQIEVDLKERAGEAAFNRRRVRWDSGPLTIFRRPQSLAGQEIFDAEKVGSPIILRHWRPGDRFQPIGMAHAVKLQDLFTNKGVPRGKRHELLVATTVKNEVFWVEGLRISERFKLTRDTRRRLIWRWK